MIGGRMPADALPTTVPLTSYEGFEAQPSFSPDGNQVVFVWNNDVFVRLIGAGEPVPLTNKADNTEIWQMPVGGGAESKIVDAILLRNFFPVPRGIYFMKPEEPGASIHFLEFATRGVRKIGSTTVPASNGLGVSSDEQWVIYSQWDQLGSDIVLAENFR